MKNAFSEEYLTKRIFHYSFYIISRSARPLGVQPGVQSLQVPLTTIWHSLG